MIHIGTINRKRTGMLWSNIVFECNSRKIDIHCGRVLYYKYDSDHIWHKNTNINTIFSDQVTIDKSYYTIEEFIADNFGEIL